jgi:hypothetical protein
MFDMFHWNGHIDPKADHFEIFYENIQVCSIEILDMNLYKD